MTGVQTCALPISALPARLLGDVAGRRVADFCAAPGGKTLQLATSGARVVAIDRSARRLERVRENLQRVKAEAELICKPCRLAFPIKDDIPVMLEDEARKIPPEVDL